MKRDIYKTIKDVKIPDRYDMSLEDMNKLRDLIITDGGDGMFDAIHTAFKYGFVLGERFGERAVLERLKTAVEK